MTHLTGRYDFDLVWGDRTRDEFFDLLREQLGLALTPEQRDVPMRGCALQVMPGGSRLVLYSDGQLTEIKVPNSVNTTLCGISCRVVGFIQPVKTTDQRVFVFEEAAYTILRTPGEAKRPVSGN